ncbi:MAG TPA: ester cyclase [Longimicrobiales bacterium]|nr:ester cyclase [Longimicrobiales bacterium]
MSAIEENKRVVRRFIEEAVNKGNVDILPELVSDHCVETDGKVRIESGLSGMAEHIRGVRTVYPDLEVSIVLQVAEGEWVATAVLAEGTHAGEWLGMAPTGETLTFSGVNLDRLVDGKIVEHGGAANMLQPFLAAGALTPSGPDAAGPRAGRGEAT